MSWDMVHKNLQYSDSNNFLKKNVFILFIENANQTSEVKCYSLHSLLLLSSALAQ